MDELMTDYKKVLTEYIELSQKETRVKLQVQNKRQQLLRCKEEMRAMEEELLELKHN